jgi:bacterioferritin B
MPSDNFVQRLNEQIENEFSASQQYVAAAIYYDDETLPRLAAFFYAQALEERNHAMMMIRYLLDAGAEAKVPGTREPTGGFGDIVEPVRISVEQEKKVSDQISTLAALARKEGDLASEQFLQWFLKEQVEEVSTMTDLLRVVERGAENPLLVEEWLAREHPGAAEPDPTAPPAAGGAL